jgi:hypothetical protein
LKLERVKKSTPLQVEVWTEILQVDPENGPRHEGDDRQRQEGPSDVNAELALDRKRALQ